MQFITVEQYAKKRGITVQAVYGLIKRKRLVSKKVPITKQIIMVEVHDEINKTEINE